MFTASAYYRLGDPTTLIPSFHRPSFLTFMFSFYVLLSLLPLTFSPSPVKVWQRPLSLRAAAGRLSHRGTGWLWTQPVSRAHCHPQEVPHAGQGVRHRPAQAEGHRGELCGIQPPHQRGLPTSGKQKVGQAACSLCHYWLGYHRYWSEHSSQPVGDFRGGVWGGMAIPLLTQIVKCIPVIRF